MRIARPKSWEEDNLAEDVFSEDVGLVLGKIELGAPDVSQVKQELGALLGTDSAIEALGRTP